MGDLILRQSQKSALEKALSTPDKCAAIWSEPRTGKTAVGLKWAEKVGARVAIVIGPKVAGLVWKREASLWLDKSYSFESLTEKGTAPKRPPLLEELNLIFINYEKFSSSYSNSYISLIKKLSREFGKDRLAIILDESHLIKNPSSKRGKAIRKLANICSYRLIITGTPVTSVNSVTDTYGQWTFLDPSIRDRWPTASSFREYFGEWYYGKGYPILVRPKNIEELYEYLQPRVAVMAKQEPLPVLRATYTLTAEQKTIYDRMKNDGVVEYKGHYFTGLLPITKLLRLRQILGGIAPDDNRNQCLFLPFFQKRCNVLLQLIARSGGKVVVSCSHLAEIKFISQELKKLRIGHSSITGSLKDKDAAITNFQTSPKIKVLLVQPKAVGIAVDLRVANTFIWYTSDFNYVTFRQASDRIKLSNSDPVVYFISAKDTVDEDIWITLFKDDSHLKKVVKSISRR